MTAPVKGAQPGFTKETLRFLRELGENNERGWFNANKHRYETHVLAPSLAFIAAMAPQLNRISSHFLASAKRSGGSLMRVYRDTRFSKNKEPYKTNIGIQFRHELGRDVHAPGFYLHIEPDGCFAAAGLWRPEPQAQASIRREISEQPALWRKASRNKRFVELFTLGGDTLKRPPKGYDEDSEYIEDIKRKDFICSTPLKHSDVLSADFSARVTGLYKRAAPLMSFLCAAMDLEF